MTAQGPRIVVGVDGSGSSKAALRWAIRQAKLTGSSVEAVAAWHYPAAYGLAPGSEGSFDFETNAKNALVLRAACPLPGPGAPRRTRGQPGAGRSGELVSRQSLRAWVGLGRPLLGTSAL
jgi:nucleotide-binding universal stress UspA family protein